MAVHPTSILKGNKTLIYILLTVLVALVVIIFILFGMEKKQAEVRIPTLEDQLIPDKPERIDFKRNGRLAFINQKNDTLHEIEIELVNNEYKRALGMMYREEMLENQGMLFIFPTEEPRGFWMKNTDLSLDMIFANTGKEIVKIHKNAKPQVDSSYNSILPCRFVVEVQAGYTDKFGISEGDKISFVIDSL